MNFGMDLKAEEKAAIGELKRRMINDLTPKLREDESLFYRFLKARDFNVKLSEDMLRKHIAWRQEFKVDTILTEYKPPEVLVKYCPITIIGCDKEGCPVMYHNMACDTKGLLASAKKIDVIKYILLIVEKVVEIMKKQSEKLGKLITKVVQIYDYGDMTFSKATNRSSIEMVKLIIDVFQDNYPERVKIIFDINTSLYFSLFFPVIKVFLANEVCNKIHFYGTDRWKEDLLQIVDADVLPAFLGGNRTDPDGDPMCNSFVIHPKTVPESYYLKKSEKSLWQTPGVQKMTVTQFSKESLTFEVKEPNSFLEWEFKTKSKDIAFGVYFKETDSKLVELIPKQRIDTYYGAETGVYKCEKPGRYIVTFDNSYSWVFQKEIYYKMQVISPSSI